MGWRRRDLWLAGVNLFFSLGFYFGFFSFLVSLLSFWVHDESRASFSIFMGSRAQRVFFIEQSSWVPVPATLY